MQRRVRRAYGGWTGDASASFVKSLGAAELLAAVGLVLPAAIDIAPVLAPLAAAGVVLLMVGAMITYLRRHEAKPAVANRADLALAAFVAVGLAVGHLLGGPNADDRLVLALATATRHPMIALSVAKTNFPDEPMLGATVLLYLLVGLIIGLPYQVWQKRRMAS